MRILHISDIHVGANVSQSFAEMVIQAIKNSKKAGLDLVPDIMVATGDFTNKGLLSEFNQAKNEMMTIKKAFTSLKECIIVPGNHDYMWTEDGKPVSADKRNMGYENFRARCKTEKLCKIYPVGLPKPIKQSLDKYLITCSFNEAEDYALLIIGMNSDMLDSAERAGQGYFEQDQLNACQKLIEYYQTKCAAKGIELISMAAFHHHILPVASVERDTLAKSDKFSLTLDARRTLDFFMESNVQLAIHGHQHQPSVVRWKDEMKGAGEGVYVVSAGSMTQNKVDLGDVSRNSFMVYDINKTDVKVYCFQNKESNWDVMEVAHEPYILSLTSPDNGCSLASLCDVRKNANPPKEIIMAKFSPECDTSDLFYLFLSVLDCGTAHNAILEYTTGIYNDSEIEICGIHHLYGKYDLLLKYRTKEGDLYQRKLRDYLKEKRLTTPDAGFYFMNVSYENKNFKEVTQIPLLKSPEAYLNSTWNMATLTVYLGQRMSTTNFFERLNNAITNFNRTQNTKIEDIIRHYAIGQDQSIIFELFISCYQFPMLTRFTNLIEDIIRDLGIDKSTHIIYHFDERHI